MPTTIRIDDDVNAFIREQGRFGESYSDVLRRLLLGFVSTPHIGSTQQTDRQVEEQARSQTAPSKLFGHSVCAVIRWMRDDGWVHAEVRKVLNSYELNHYSDSTISAQLRPLREGATAKLSAEQISELRNRR